MTRRRKAHSETPAVTSPHGSRLELAQLIESDLAHWRVCRKNPCAECEFAEKILALAGNMIFSEQTCDQSATLAPARLHAQLDALARSNSPWLSLIAKTIDCADKKYRETA